MAAPSTVTGPTQHRYAAPANRPQVFKRGGATRRRLDPVEVAILAVVAMYQADNRDDIAIGHLESLLAPNVATGRISELHTFGALSTPRDNAGDPIGTKCRLTRQGLDELRDRASAALEEARRLQKSTSPADNPQNMWKVLEILEGFLGRRKPASEDPEAELLDDPDPADGAGLDDDTEPEELEDQLEELELPDDEPPPRATTQTPATPEPRAGSRAKAGGASKRGPQRGARRGKAT